MNKRKKFIVEVYYDLYAEQLMTQHWVDPENFRPNTDTTPTQVIFRVKAWKDAK